MTVFHIVHHLTRFVVPVVLSVVSLIVAKPDKADARTVSIQPQSRGFQVSVAPFTQPLTQGEPLTLSYRIENHSDRSVLATLRFKGNDWLDASLVRLDGSQSKAIFCKTYGAGRDAALVSPEEAFREERIVARWETPPPPGHYQLRVSVQLPYGEVGADLDDDVIAAGKKDVYRATLLFPVTILPADSARLAEVATGIKQKLLTYGSYDTDILCQRLFALPVGVFYPVLADLARTPNLDMDIRQVVAQQLSLLGSKETADLLAEMAWEIEYPKVGEREKHWQEACIGALRMMYKEANDDLKSHIKEILARHQSKLAEFTKEPQHQKAGRDQPLRA